MMAMVFISEREKVFEELKKRNLTIDELADILDMKRVNVQTYIQRLKSEGAVKIINRKRVDGVKKPLNVYTCINDDNNKKVERNIDSLKLLMDFFQDNAKYLRQRPENIEFFKENAEKFKKIADIITKKSLEEGDILNE